MKKATSLYSEFTGHEVDQIIEVDVKPITHGLRIGRLDGVIYTTVRDGKTESYIHEFKKKSAPTLISNHSGNQLGLVGGDYTFKDSGINDN